MNIDASILISTISAVVALFSWFETRRMSQLTKLALELQSYEKAETLPSVSALGVVKVNGKVRVKLIIFNQRENPIIVNCVKCKRYAPKPRTPSNMIRSLLGPFDWNYSQEDIFWNPKGPLDDAEHFSEETLPFTLVKEQEILLVTINELDQNAKYLFEVITSQGIATCEGTLPNGKTHLPHEHRSRIRTISHSNL